MAYKHCQKFQSPE